MIPILSCNLCSGTNLEFEWSISARETGLPEDIHMTVCRNCFLSFISPQPNSVELKPFYDKDYASYVPAKKWKTSVYMNFVRLFWDSREKPYFFIKPFSFLLSLMRGIRIMPGARVLDIGCGNGDYPKVIANLGMQAFGVEPYYILPSGEKPPSNTFIHATDLFSAQFPDEYFEIVTLNHVLEHMHDPMRTLSEVHRILKKKGRVFIGVPNRNSWINSIFRHYSQLYDPPRHLFHFSLDILRKYSEKLCFKIIQERSIWNAWIYMDTLIKACTKKVIVKNTLAAPKALQLLPLVSLPFEMLAGCFKRSSCIEVEWERL